MQLQGAMRVMGLLCAITALAMFTGTAQASSSLSSVATTVANSCSHVTSHVAAPRHRREGLRALSSAQASKIQRMCRAARPYIARINHWYSQGNRWTLYLSPANKRLTCHQLRQKRRLLGPEALCYRARTQVRLHSQRLVRINARIKALLPKPVIQASGFAYRHFTTCDQAVRYIFAGRSDIGRALMVVRRESTDNPDAANGSHLGCAEESDKMRSTFLKGPWNDAFWNVLAMREVVDSPSWGWCNWDLVNYCSPGGEF